MSDIPTIYSHWVIIPGVEVIEGDILFPGLVVDNPETFRTSSWQLVQLRVPDSENEYF